MHVALATLDRSRLGVAAQAVGIAQGATDHAAAYARERRQFGRPIAEFQGIQFKLADMETRTAAARELLYKACAKADRDEPDMGKYSAMAKLFASDTAMAVTVDAIQVLGGYGYVTEYPVERYHARREDHPDLRGHERDPAARDRAARCAERRCAHAPPGAGLPRGTLRRCSRTGRPVGGSSPPCSSASAWRS